MVKKEVNLLILSTIIVIIFIVSVNAATIFTDGFESGSLSGWTLTTGTNMNNWTASTVNPNSGSWHAQSQPQGLNLPPSTMNRTISTAGYQNINFSYYHQLVGIDPGDEFTVAWFDGIGWITVETTGSNASDESSYSLKSFLLPSSADNNLNFKIKFECTAGAVSEFCRVDEISITGDVIDTTPPIVTINFPANNAFYKSTLNFNVSLNENGSTIYSLNGGISNKTMLYTTDNLSPFGTLFNHTNNSIADGTYTFQVYANDTNGNKNYTTTTQFTYDTINPLLKIIQPQNTTYNTDSLQINFTVSDVNLNSCWYTNNNGQTNTTLSNCQNASYSAQQGSTTLLLYANDSAGNINSSSVTFFVDSIIPLISFTNPTKQNNSILSQSSIFINTSINETNFANITFSLYNITSLVNMTIFASQILSINFTSLQDGVYFYNVTIKDTLNNQNTTETRTITLDTTAPSLNLTIPKNISYNSIQTELNYTISDTNLQSCWYTTNGGTTNTSIICGNNISSLSSSQGSNTWIIYANDSAGNANSPSVTFFVDSIIPSLSIITPTEGSTFGTNTSLALNFTVSDTNLQSCWYNIDNSNNITIQNCLNTTFNTSASEHTLFLYANDSLNNERKANVSFTVSIGAPTITQSSPINIYLNSSQTTFYYTATDVDLNACEIWGNFTGQYLLNQTNSTLISGQQSQFNISLSDNGYIWAIKCNDTLGNSAITGNKTFSIDTIYPKITLSEPSGTKTSRNNIPITFTTSDNNIQSCWYNLYRGLNLEIANTTISCSQSSFFNTTVDASFTLNFYVNDSANNINTSLISFNVDTSSPSNGGGSGGGGSSGGGGISAKGKNETFSLEIKLLETIAIKRGTNISLNLEVTNKDKKFANNCRIILNSPLKNYAINSEIKGLSPGEKFIFNIFINIPLNSEIGKFNSEISVKCEEGSKSINHDIFVYRNSFEARLLNYERETDRLKITYVLEEFSQKDHDIQLNYKLTDSKSILVLEGSEKIILKPGERQENNLNINIPKGLTGEFNLDIILKDESSINQLSEKVDLTGKLTGFAISDENRRTLSLFGIITVSCIIIFFISRLVYNKLKKIKPPHLKDNIEERNGRRLIKLNIKQDIRLNRNL